MTVAGGGAVLGGGPGAAQQEPVQLQRAGDAQGDVYYCGHGQLPGGYCRYPRYSRYLHHTSAGGVRGGAQDGAGGHLRHQDEGDRAEGDLRGYRPAAAQVRS